MALLSDSLSVWELAFRWAGRDSRGLCLRIPLDVQDHVRNLMDAILSAELACLSITLEKRRFEPDERDFSIYYWLDDIYLCIAGLKFNRKLLRHALIDRYDFKLWCERRNIPLPEFWFPSGWNLEYDLPEGDIRPGHYFQRSHWTSENWDAWEKEQAEAADSSPGDNEVESQSPQDQTGDTPPLDESPPADPETKEEAAVEKLRPNQEATIACRQIAKAIWKDDPSRTIASVVTDELIQKYGGAVHFASATVREWIKVVAPPDVRNRRGRPKKGAEGE